jgi:hypothetical protein
MSTKKREKNNKGNEPMQDFHKNKLPNSQGLENFAKPSRTIYHRPQTKILHYL